MGTSKPKRLKAEVPERDPIRVSRTRTPRPFLKWAGGKMQLLPDLTSRIPVFPGRYIEPFAGGGALFFWLTPKNALLQDFNVELIHCYTVIRDHVDELIECLRKFRYTEKDYYRIRATDPDKLDDANRAARTVYLNKTGFNGLYRVNSKGKFNVPMGRYVNPRILDEKNLRACSAALATTTLNAVSFESVVESAEAGDFVYLDPPYIPLSRTANFTAYQRGGFNEDNQAELARVFNALTQKGAYAMLSNSDVPWIHENYEGHRIELVQATRSVNRNADGRGPISEVIVMNYDY